jgi:quercetin dioxygenase-like cupin family protein
VQVSDRFPIAEVAPNHSHFYDEIVYIIDGEGILHLGGEQKVIGPGSAIHLPPLAEHCLENTGKGSMRVLGVFSSLRRSRLEGARVRMTLRSKNKEEG